MKKIFKSLWPYLRVLLSLLLLWLAVRNIDWKTLSETRIAMQPGWLVLAWLTLVLDNILVAFRWGFLMRSMGLSQSWRTYITLYFTGGLINQGLPSTIGGDSYRAIEGSRRPADLSSPDLISLDKELHEPIDLMHTPPRLRLSFFAVAIDRGIGLIGNNILGALGLLIGGAIIGDWAQSLGFWVLITMVGGCSLACLLIGMQTTRRIIQKILNKMGMPHAMHCIRMGFGWPNVFAQITFSVATHALVTLSFLMCLHAFGATVSFEALMIGLPALGLLMILPISISGWGLREATLSAVLVLWGVEAGVTVLASICFGLVTVVTYLPGAIALLQRRNLGLKSNPSKLNPS